MNDAPRPDPAPPEQEKPYGLDDLIAYEKGQTKLILVLFVLALGWAVLQRLRGDEADAPAPPDRDGPPPAEAPADPAPAGTQR